MKIIAWNVNGIKSLLKTKELDEYIEKEKPDIFCMGETKISCPFIETQEELNKRISGLKYRYWSPCQIRNGYSGTAIFSRIEPISIEYGIIDKNKNIDQEGRVITLEYDNFILIHVYTPNSGDGLKRLDYRINEWDKIFSRFVRIKQSKKDVIVCGDLNVAHKEIDLKNPKTNLRTAGFTIEERKSFDKLLTKNNLVDTYRELNDDKVEYSFWSYRFKSRERNVGWRIDYFIVSKKLLKNIKKSEIDTEIMGSDHAPIKLEIEI